MNSTPPAGTCLAVAFEGNVTEADSVDSVTGSAGNFTASGIPGPGAPVPAASPVTLMAGRAPAPAALASTARVKPSGSIATGSGGRCPCECTTVCTVWPASTGIWPADIPQQRAAAVAAAGYASKIDGEHDRPDLAAADALPAERDRVHCSSQPLHVRYAPSAASPSIMTAVYTRPPP